MRINLATLMKPNSTISFSIKWWYNINDYQKMEAVPVTNSLRRKQIVCNCQFYPRMAVYNDVEGWQNTILGSESALPFGDFDVILPFLLTTLWKRQGS
jgi:hypothetical protein